MTSRLKINVQASGAYASPHIRLLEYDQRFNVFDEEFVHYTYETPTRLPGKYSPQQWLMFGADQGSGDERVLQPHSVRSSVS